MPPTSSAARPTGPGPYAPLVGAAVGAAGGVLSVLLMWMLDMVSRDLEVSLLNVLLVHRLNPLHWVLDLLPILLGWLGWIQVVALMARHESRRVALALQSSAYGSGDLARSMIDGVLVVAGDGYIEQANPSAGRIFGYPAAELVGMPIRRLIPDHDRQKGSMKLRTTSSKEVLGASWAMTAAHRDGTQFPIELSYAPTPDRRFVYVVRDASERLRVETHLGNEIERLQAQVEARSPVKVDEDDVPGTDLANMSYQIRGPLNAILGFSEVLADRLEGSEVETQELSRIRQSARQLLDLVNNALDYAKLSAGAMSIVLEPTHVGKLVLDLERIALPLAAENANELELLIDPMVTTVRTDGERLRQILVNLLSNACKFTTEGTVRLEVGYHDDDDGARWVAVRVRDTGIGMGPELVQAVKAGGLRHRVGSGLGLVVASRLTQIIGGRLEVSSAEGEGSVFTVMLPTPYRAGGTLIPGERGEEQRAALTFYPPDSPEDEDVHIRAKDATPTPAPAPRRRRRGLLGGPGKLVAGGSRTEAAPSNVDGELILLIDDEPPALRELIVRHLADQGYRVAVATTGNDGLTLAYQERPTAIVLEVMVQEREGWEVLEVLRGDPALSTIPVIVASIDDDEERALSLGAVASLPKPIDRSRLTATLDRCRTPTPSVLVTVRDPQRRDLLCEALSQAGWRVARASNGVDALDLANQETPAAFVVDPGLDDMPNTELFRALRTNPAWRHLPTVAVGVATDDAAIERYKPVASAVITVGEPKQVASLVCTAIAQLLQAEE